MMSVFRLGFDDLVGRALGVATVFNWAFQMVSALTSNKATYKAIAQTRYLIVGQVVNMVFEPLVKATSTVRSNQI